jgi:hypothetical protein
VRYCQNALSVLGNLYSRCCAGPGKVDRAVFAEASDVELFPALEPINEARAVDAWAHHEQGFGAAIIRATLVGTLSAVPGRLHVPGNAHLSQGMLCVKRNISVESCYVNMTECETTQDGSAIFVFILGGQDGRPHGRNAR